MKNIFLQYAVLLFALLAISCDKEDDLIINEAENPYELPQGNETYMSFIREFYQETQTYILTDYVEKEYQWNVNTVDTRLKFKIAKDVEFLNKMPEYLRKVFSDSYTKEFLKKYGPFKILVADTISRDSDSDLHTYSGIDYLAIGHINERLSTFTETELKDISGQVHGRYWGHYMHRYERLVMTKKWYTLVDDTQDTNIALLSTPKEQDDGIIHEPQYYGYWATYKNGNKNMTPNYEMDIAQYVEKLCTLTPEEIEEQTNDYPIMQEKVRIIKEHIQLTFGVDITSL